jgi:chromosomal replication initiator protein
MDAYQLWQAALGQVQLQLSRPTFDTWLKNTRGISYEDGVLVVSVHSAYAKDWLENRLYGQIQRTASDIAQRTLTLRFVVGRNGATEKGDASLFEAMELTTTAMDSEIDVPDCAEARINSRYTFETFIIGQSNRLAHAGCLAVAENPGHAYNPLFIYGGVGLGKTHLLHAIGNHVMKDQRKCLYVSAETFTNELINAIRNRTTDEFRARYRTMDVLLIDDVQFIVNKERTQEEFFHTFNDLYQDNRQIVLSSDRPPKAFSGLEERLRSRFEWGLITDIHAPELETRIAILESKAEQQGVQMPGGVLEFVAQQVPSNIRELEGALNRVLALGRMMGYPWTIQTAQKALGDAMRTTEVHVTIEQILQAVAAQYGVGIDSLVGPRRSRELATARQVAMYLARQMTRMSLPQLGEALGGRDHTTIMYGCEKITALIETDDRLRRQIQEVKNALSARNQPVAEGERSRRS